MSRLALLIAAVLLVTPAALRAQTQTPAVPAATMEEPMMGDHWTYDLRDEITGELKSTYLQTVTDVTPTEVSIRQSVLGRPNYGYLTYDRSWSLTDGGTWRYTPNDGLGIRQPLSVGKTWTFSATEVNAAAGATWRRSGTSTVLAQESITTKAGTFDAFKIQYAVQEQNSIDPTKKLSALTEIWYAPAIDHWVKRTSEARMDGKLREKSTIELVEYGRRSN